MAAALAVLDVLDDERVLERGVDAGAALRAGDPRHSRSRPVIGDVRGRGPGDRGRYRARPRVDGAAIARDGVGDQGGR